MNIANLTRPIVFLDIETTGVNPQEDRIVELSMVKLFTDGKRETGTSRVNPGIPIPPAATEVHGITDADVANEKYFKDIANNVLAYIEGCDIGGFNCNRFDIPLLFEEFCRCGLTWNYSKSRFIDVGNIFKRQQERTLSAAVKHYLGREHEDAHGAEADVLATIEVFEKQLNQHSDLPQDWDELHLYCNFDKQVLDLSGKFVEQDGQIILNFGKHRGEPAENHLDYLLWMLDKDFSIDTKAVARAILDGSS